MSTEPSVGFLFIAFCGVVFSIFTFEGNEETKWAIVYVVYFFQLFLPFMVFFGAYLHVIKRNNLGFGLLTILSSILLCFYAYAGFFALLVGPPSQFHILIIYLLSPVLLIICAMISALVNFLSSPKNEQFS
jgi:hypothetical protein